MAWNDAGTSDESRRQDRLVDAAIEQGRTNSRFLRCYLGASFVGAVGCYLYSGSVAVAAVILGAPIATQFITIIPDFFQKASEKQKMTHS